MKTLITGVLVIGGGLAGLRVAVAARRRGHDTLVLSRVPPKRSHSAAAQGGMQAALANVVQGEGDNEDIHFEDTVRGSDWGADQDVVRMFVHTAPKAVRELAGWGVPWSRVQAGDRQVVVNGQNQTLTESAQAQGLIAQRNFGGTRKWRTCHVSDGTGHAMLFALSDRAIAEGIPVLERVEAIRLIHDGQRCHGAIVRNLVDGELFVVLATATVMATGGAGRVYRVSTNAVICDGSGHALALDTGVVGLGNMEAVQFHPTGIFPAGILVTEGCRGDGGLLRDAAGHRFMPDYEPEKKELASRDVVSRRMEQHIAAGHGVHTRYGEHLWLDISLLGAAHIKRNLREVQDICRYFLGIDPAQQWIPVRPAQHYTMGGVRTDASGHSRHLNGLFAAGEAACWDLHGFNRLGGNSVAETVVAGMIVGEAVADYCDAAQHEVPMALVKHQFAQEQARIDALLESSADQSASELLAAMQTLMTADVGIFRSGERLSHAVETLGELLQRSQRLGLRSRRLAANPELELALRLPGMLRVAMCIAAGALARTESRGAHYRQDYPQRDDAQWLKRTLAHWPAGATQPTLSYESLSVMDMELAPGWRGYGARDQIEHPDTARRLAQQTAPSRDWRLQLPAALRGDNQRIDHHGI